MPVALNFLKGTDLPSWHWLNQLYAGNFYGGHSNDYDGVRYVYWAVQFGSSTNGTASTTQFWRYDTWTNGWQFLVNLTAATGALDISYDSLRGVVWIIEAATTTSTSWRFYNPTNASITLAGVTAAAYALGGVITPVLPAATSGTTSESQVNTVSDTAVPAMLPSRADVTSSKFSGSNTTTSLSDPLAEFHSGLIGCAVRMTSGVLSGQTRIITAVPNLTTLTVTAFGGTPGTADNYQLEIPGGFVDATGFAATSGSTTTVVATGAGFPVNQYRDSDVIITAGTGVGQRRRIGSNDATTLTLAATVTGNPRTGAFGVAPDATSKFRIVPSSDFVYYMPGVTTGLYKIDVQATALAWTTLTVSPAALGAGASAFYSPSYAPFGLVAFRGGATTNIYRYDIGLQTWATLASTWGGESLTTGGTAALLPNRSKMFLQISATNRCYLYSPATGALEAFASLPYAPPAAYSGKHARFIRTADGVDFGYFARAGGQEWFRIPLEWL